MVTAALLLVLHGAPDVRHAFLSGDVPRSVRLVDQPAEKVPNYESWTRGQLRTEYNRLEELRPGLFMPVTLIIVGASTALISGMVLGIELGQFFGTALGVAIGLTVTIVVAVGILAVGVIILVRNAPERRAIGQELDLIEESYRNGPWFNRERPCPDVPSPGAPRPPVWQDPQVMAPHLLTLAEF